MTDPINPAEPVAAGPVAAGPVAAEPIAAETVAAAPVAAEQSKQIALDDVPESNIEMAATVSDSFLDKGLSKVKGMFNFKNKTSDTTKSESESNFFNKLVSGTKNLLSHAETFTDTAYQKTKEISQKVAQMPGKIATTASETVQK
ncbi:MAG: hypothetical protein GX128_02200 [Bacteroidales bacterium]|nr:hypothetical protein [Bacteroidales bacterium]